MTSTSPQKRADTRPAPTGPILVTGAHRSGTTWVGKMLNASQQTAYISEPLNVLHRPGVLRTPISHWYTYITDDNEAEYLPGLKETLALKYHLGLELRSVRSLVDLLRMWRDGWTFARGRLLRQRPLLKDPFAIFSSPWFSKRLGCQVVITIRHPAAFASSLKRLNWPFDFSDLLAQPLLMRDWLEPYRAQIEQAVNHPADTVTGASLLWCLIYATVARFEHEYPHFILVRHEDLSADPVNAFKQLYDRVGLKFTRNCVASIRNASNAENPSELSLRRKSIFTRRSAHSVRLDSRANLQNWKRRLNPDEIRQIRAQTEQVASHFYPDFQWN